MNLQSNSENLNSCIQEYQKMSLNSTRKKPHCSYCKNHDKTTLKTNHKCKFEMRCECVLCKLTKKSQVAMRHQQRFWRYRKNQGKLSNVLPDSRQKCDNCRNHFVYVEKKNHNCPYEKCECKLCMLTNTRREVMKMSQRTRRLGVTADSTIHEDDGFEEENSIEEDAKSHHYKDVDLKATGCTDMEMLTTSSDISLEDDRNISSNYSSRCSTTSHSRRKGTDPQSTHGKGTRETLCPSNRYSVSPEALSSSPSSTRERRYSAPHQSQTKYIGYDKTPSGTGFPFAFSTSSFLLEDQQSRFRSSDDLRTTFFDPSPSSPLNLSTETRNPVGISDCRSNINHHYQKIPFTLPSPLAQVNQVSPSSSSYNPGSSSNQNPILRPQYMTPNQRIPIKPVAVKGNMSFSYPFSTSSSSLGVHRSRLKQFFQSGYPHYSALDLLRIWELRNQFQ